MAVSRSLIGPWDLLPAAPGWRDIYPARSAHADSIENFFFPFFFSLCCVPRPIDRSLLLPVVISLEKRLIYRLFGSLSFSLSCSCSVSTPLSFQCRLYYHHSLFPPFAHFSNEKKVDRRAQLNDADRWRTLGGGKGSKKERVCAVRLRACVYLSGRKRKMGGRRTKRLICSIYIRDWKERGSRLLGGEEGDRYYIDWDRQADERTDERTDERDQWCSVAAILDF